MGTSPVRTSFRSPWQNGTAERWIGSCRQEMLEHVVVLSERHLVRLARSYIDYYHEDRCHLGLDKDSPNERPVTPRPSPTAKVVALPRVGGAAPSLRMAGGSLEQFSAAKGRVTGALEVYVVQRMNPFAVRSLKRPGRVDPRFRSSLVEPDGLPGRRIINDERQLILTCPINCSGQVIPDTLLRVFS